MLESFVKSIGLRWLFLVSSLGIITRPAERQRNEALKLIRALGVVHLPPACISCVRQLVNDIVIYIRLFATKAD